jgi:hypothetical protein
VTLLPSVFIAASSETGKSPQIVEMNPPKRSVANRILAPSGDQAGL